jgi:peptidyl-prolyl cis-trans isomerase SurA
MPRRAPALALCLALFAGAARGEQMLVDGIAAQVGSEIVLVSEVLELVGPIEAEARAQGAEERDVAKLRADALEQLIERRLLSRVAHDAHLEASDSDVDAAIEGIAKDNGLSLDQLRASLASHGVRWDEYRGRIKAEVERQKVINAMVGAQITVEESELRAAYREMYAAQPQGGEEVHIKQILVLGGEGAPRDLPAACALARDAAARIARGEPFEKLAQEISAAAPQQGGDIGWLHVGAMASWMRDPLQHLEPGATSPVIELPFGCTLLQLVERKSFEPVSFEQAKASLQQEVYQRKVMEKYREWMESLRKRTFISRRSYFAETASASAKPAGLAPRGEAGAGAAEEPPAAP